MPFYPRRASDDGYDITDFYGVDPRLGTHGDFVELVRTARDRGIRVIADLVVNHTSDQHPWFQAARADRDSPYRDFYVWADEKPPEKPGDVVFPDKEDSNWAWDEEGGPVLPAPLLLAPARPQRRQPGGPRRDRPGGRLLARAGAQRLPRRRRPVHARADGHAGRRARRPARAAARPAPLHRPPQRRGRSCSARSTCRRGPARRSSATRTATSCTCCSRSPSTRRCTWRSRASRPRRSSRRSPRCRDPPRLPVGELRAQPRRADARQALRRRARGGVRRLRARRGAAAVRPRPAPAAADDARRRRAADPDGLQPDVLAAGHAGAVLRRGDRDGREPRDRGPHERARADAVVGRAQRRLLDRRGPRGARAAR